MYPSAPAGFYHEEENDKVRSFENLKEIYLKSVGGNCTLLLNIPPDTDGLIREEDRRSLFMLGVFHPGVLWQESG